MKHWSDDFMGRQGQDEITGFKGMITSKVSYITGCDRILLTPKTDKDGKTIEGLYFDINRVKVLKGKRLDLGIEERQKVGSMDEPPIK